MLEEGALPGEANIRLVTTVLISLFLPIVVPVHQITRIIPSFIRPYLEYLL